MKKAVTFFVALIFAVGAGSVASPYAYAKEKEKKIYGWEGGAYQKPKKKIDKPVHVDRKKKVAEPNRGKDKKRK
jgi:hypothetical protein